MGQRVKVLRVTPEFIADLFRPGIHRFEVRAEGVPENAAIVSCDWDGKRNVFLIMISHPSFPETENTDILPQIAPVCFALPRGA
jgi:hypothetical protein